MATAYHASNTPPEKFPEILKAWKAGSGSGKKQYGDGAYLVLDNNLDSATFKGKYGKYIYKLEVDLNGFVIFEPDAAKEVHGKNTSIAAQLRAMGKPEVVEELKSYLSSRASEEEEKDDARAQAGDDYSATKSVYSWALNPLSVDGRLDTERGPGGEIKGWNTMAQEYSSILQNRVNGILFAAGSEKNRVIAVYKPEIISPIAYYSYYDNQLPSVGGKELGGFGEDVAEEWLAAMKKQALDAARASYSPEEFKKFESEWEPNDYMRGEYERIKRGIEWQEF